MFLSLVAIILAMEQQALQFITYYEEQMKIAARLANIRKRRKISQKKLAVISGVKYASIRRFEKTGDISFKSLVKIALALQLYDDLNNLFKNVEYRSIEEALNG